MTETNHRRMPGRLPSDLTTSAPSHSGILSKDRPWQPRKWYLKVTGNFLQLSDRLVSATAGHHFSDGHRGAAKKTLGAKKYVRTRTRFHENAATRKLAAEYNPSLDEN